jgi:hypothetical protein
MASDQISKHAVSEASTAMPRESDITGDMAPPKSASRHSKTIPLPAPEVDITKTSLWLTAATVGMYDPGHEIIAENLKVIARQNQDIRKMLSQLVSARQLQKAQQARGQTNSELWRDEEAKEWLIALCKTYKDKGGKMVKTASKHSADYANTWKSAILELLNENDAVDSTIQKALNDIAGAPVQSLYLRASQLLAKLGMSEKGAERGHKAKKAGKGAAASKPSRKRRAGALEDSVTGDESEELNEDESAGRRSDEEVGERLERGEEMDADDDGEANETVEALPNTRLSKRRRLNRTES